MRLDTIQYNQKFYLKLKRRRINKNNNSIIVSLTFNTTNYLGHMKSRQILWQGWNTM